MTVWHMHIAWWIPKAIDTHSEYQFLLLFHCNSGCRNAPECYIICILPVLLSFLVEEDELLKCYYEWQLGNWKCESWAVSLRDEMYKLVFRYTLFDRWEMDLEYICQIIRTRCRDIQRQWSREKMKEKTFLVLYWNMKQYGWRGIYIYI